MWILQLHFTSEDAISNGTFGVTMRCRTVEYEYEVRGVYCVQKDGLVQNGHLYVVEYIPPSKDISRGYHRHCVSIKSHG